MGVHWVFSPPGGETQSCPLGVCQHTELPRQPVCLSGARGSPSTSALEVFSFQRAHTWCIAAPSAGFGKLDPEASPCRAGRSTAASQVVF